MQIRNMYSAHVRCIHHVSVSCLMQAISSPDDTIMTSIQATVCCRVGHAIICIPPHNHSLWASQRLLDTSQLQRVAWHLTVARGCLTLNKLSMLVCYECRYVCVRVCVCVCVDVAKAAYHQKRPRTAPFDPWFVWRMETDLESMYVYMYAFMCVCVCACMACLYDMYAFVCYEASCSWKPICMYTWIHSYIWESRITNLILIVYQLFWMCIYIQTYIYVYIYI